MSALPDSAEGVGIDAKVASALRVTRNKLGYRGVARQGNLYDARIGSHNKGNRASLGCFKTPEEAAAAYDEAAVLMYGDAACLNFPLNKEHAVIRSRREDGLCPYGHTLAEKALRHHSGRLDCRTCRDARNQRRRVKKPAAFSWQRIETAPMGRDDCVLVWDEVCFPYPVLAYWDDGYLDVKGKRVLADKPRWRPVEDELEKYVDCQGGLLPDWWLPWKPPL